MFQAIFIHIFIKSVYEMAVYKSSDHVMYVINISEKAYAYSPKMIIFFCAGCNGIINIFASIIG